MDIFHLFDTARQLSDSAEPTSRLGSLLATMQDVQLFGEVFVVLALVLALLLLGCTVWMFRLSRILKKKESSYQQDVQSKSRQIQMLQHKVNSFDEARDGYLSLITNMSFVMRNVNFQQKLEDLTETLSSLLKNILNTDTAEFYIYEPEEDLLRKVVPHGQTSSGKIALPLGKGLIGTAAKDGMILTREYFNRKYLDDDEPPKMSRKLWMAAPILFKKQILGVIAVGETLRPTGTEKDLLGIVAQIAGVVLYHQSFLLRARQNADTDVLTGLHNRRYFYRMSRRLVEKATQEHSPISLLLIDLDHFKQYNDTNGHDEGDRLLIEFGGLLRGCAPEDAVVARYGGEEFIVMLPGVPTEEAYRYGDYLRQTVQNHAFPHLDTQPFGFISISGGVASFPNHGRSIQDVIRLADSAMYKAKQSGRNRVLAHSSCLSVADDGEPSTFGPAEQEEWLVEGHRKAG